MEYYINVAKRSGDYWIYYFRACVSFGNVKKVYNELKSAFPDCKIDIYKKEIVTSSLYPDLIDF